VFGMACGAGFFSLAAIASSAAMLVLIVGGPIELALERRFVRSPQDKQADGDDTLA